MNEWLVYLILIAIGGFIISIIVLHSESVEEEEKKHWTPKYGEIKPNQKWFTKY